MGLGDIGKRLLIGRKLRSTQLGETLLPKRVALPVFASDALSSVAYAPDEVFLTLSVAGVAAVGISWKVAIAVAFILTVVVLSYRQNVHAYPSGGGDYEVATTNLGANAGLTVASALLVDYVLTVAVSISSAAQYAAAAIPWLDGKQAVVAALAVLLLTTMNLRGVRESGTLFAVPTYLFMVSIIGMAIVGFFRLGLGHLPSTESSGFTLLAEEPFAGGASTLVMGFLVLRAFTSGCAALTGVEAISNGVPAFRKPKSKNAATTLALLGSIAITMLLSIIVLANIMHIRFAENPATQLLGGNGQPLGPGYSQDPVIGQLARGIFDHFSPGFYLITATTGVILMLAANTAFNGFPVLGSILAKDGYLPRQLHTRGDRLAYSNGILILALFAIVLIIAFDAQVTRLIQLYIVGVFVSFTTSQTGMIRHWTRLLRTETDRTKRAAMMRSRVINFIGMVFTGVVLIVVLLTKFIHGAYIAIIAMVVIFVLMKGIRRHYDHVSQRMTPGDRAKFTLPTKVHAVVLVSKLHRPTLRALAFAKVSRPHILEAVTVEVDPDETEALRADWERRDIPVPLKVLASPYREITRPIMEYIRNVREDSPGELVMVYIPEYVVGHWWEQVLHNQSALRLKSRLLFVPGVMVTSVPYQLESSRGRDDADNDPPTAGDARRAHRVNA